MVNRRYNRREVNGQVLYPVGMALRIKELRKAANLSQEELGKMAGVSRSQLSEIENEQKPANTLRLRAIANALGVPVEELFAPADDQGQRAIILMLFDRITDPDDRQALVRHAEALASRFN
jgi:transcriptional regulator with XRE-family HTH domain